MIFNIIVGNPPYQESDGGGQGSSAKPMYHHFVLSASNFPKATVSMIIPNRWMFGGKGLDNFRNFMLSSERVSELHTYRNADDMFGILLPGGVDYFLIDGSKHQLCKVVNHPENVEAFRDLDSSENFIMSNLAESIFNKADIGASIASFSEVVSERNPFNLASNVFTEPNYYGLPFMKDEPFDGCVNVIGVENNVRKTQYVDRGYAFTDKHNALGKYKIFIPKALGNKKDLTRALLRPFLGDVDDICTETYLMVGPFDNAFEQLSAYSYINTKLFHFLVNQAVSSHNLTKDKFKHVPNLMLNRIYTDKDVYDIFGLTDDEIHYVESSVPDIE